MKLKEELLKTGKLPEYDIEKEIETLLQLSDSKPSKRIISNKKGRKAIAALRQLREKHNHSWYKELKQRTVDKGKGNELALFYRGNKITFNQLFERADALAKSLKENGIEAGDEIPVCMANTPELVYLMLAANKVGAKINSFGPQFNKEYLKQILAGCTDKVFFATDDFYEEIKDIVSEKQYPKTVVVSLADSVPEKPEETDEYEPELDSYYRMNNLVPEFKKENKNISSFNEYIQYGENYTKEVEDVGKLDTEFLITYTSGSTKIGWPKAIMHTNRSLIVSGRFHDAELTGNPDLKRLRGLASVHAESNTDLITCISDNLMQTWSVALEPIYDADEFLNTLIINKPNYVNASTNFFIKAAKQYLYEKRFHEDGKGRKLPFLFAAFAAGEPLQPGEEKLINRFLRESRAGSGVKIKGLSLPFVTLSIGGGDCEHGGIYYTLWKALYEKLNALKLRKKPLGMKPESYVHITVLKKDENGQFVECDYNEYGLVVSNSATNMIGYKNNIEATSNLIVRDNLGRDWLSCNVYGMIDEFGTAHIKGRAENVITLDNGVTIPMYMIEDEITKDTKNILSCNVVCVEKDGEYPVVNIQQQKESKLTEEQVIRQVCGILSSKFPRELIDKLIFRFFPFEEMMPLTVSGKRSIKKLEDLEFENTVKLENRIITGEEFIQNRSKSNQYVKKLT